MFTVSVNGCEYESVEDKSLLRFLRDDLHLTATKDGCSQGVCGTCTVLVGGVKKRACIVKLSQIKGQPVLTVEGIPAAEMRIYEYCFAAAGAVQCGFCIPGMIISAKALLDKNLNPSRTEIRQAIKGNLCRCTGYVKIIAAIELAATFFREKRELPPPAPTMHINSDSLRPDAAAKVNGSALFGDDIVVPGMVHAAALYSPYPRARLERLDVSKAVAHPACLRVLTKADVPCNNTGIITKDQEIMIGVGEITKFVGSVIAVAVAEKASDLAEIISLIEADFTVLEPVTSAYESRREGAPQVHPNYPNLMNVTGLERGQVDGAIANSPYIVTQSYSMSWQEHGYMETECCVAIPEGDDGLHIFSGAQSVYEVQRGCAEVLNIPVEKVRCTSPYIGGGFGGKEDLTVQPYAALLAWYLKRPVKFRFNRQESLDYHVKRHPMDITITIACDDEGHFTAIKGEIIGDSGAFSSLSRPVMHRACVHMAGPYRCKNVEVKGYSYYTNNVPSGAFRGFGVTQSCFATESTINLLAEKVGIDPWELRWRNIVHDGDTLANGQLVGPDARIADCMLAIKESFYARPDSGLSCAFKNAGIGLGRPDVGRVLLSIEDGKVHLRTSAACMGQGIAFTMMTILCEITGLSPQDIVFESADTERTPDAGTTSASRQTLITGEAVRRAAEQLLEAMRETSSLAALEGQTFFGEYETKTDALDSDAEYPVSHVAYSYGAQVVWLDEAGKVEKVISAFDVGTPVNIKAVEGQIEGGTVMGLGFALSERYRYENGYPKSKMATIGFLRADNVPEQEIILCRPSAEDRIPYALGAKGCGEISAIPTAPACAHAYYRRDNKFRTTLPLEGTVYINS